MAINVFWKSTDLILQHCQTASLLDPLSLSLSPAVESLMLGSVQTQKKGEILCVHQTCTPSALPHDVSTFHWEAIEVGPICPPMECWHIMWGAIGVHVWCAHSTTHIYMLLHKIGAVSFQLWWQWLWVYWPSTFVSVSQWMWVHWPFTFIYVR